VARRVRWRSSTARWRQPSGSAFASGSAGAAIWLVGHVAAVWAAKRDPAFVDVVRRHLRYPQHMVV
jgi:type IV secretory pathway TrbD component